MSNDRPPSGQQDTPSKGEIIVIGIVLVCIGIGIGILYFLLPEVWNDIKSIPSWEDFGKLPEEK